MKSIKIDYGIFLAIYAIKLVIIPLFRPSFCCYFWEAFLNHLVLILLWTWAIVNIVPTKLSVLVHLYDWIPSFLIYDIFNGDSAKKLRDRERSTMTGTSPWSSSLSQSLYMHGPMPAGARAYAFVLACHYSKLETLRLKTTIIQQIFLNLFGCIGVDLAKTK